jgi:sRNA-binding protein
MHQRAMKMQETLAERFPDCFQVSGPRLPLKVVSTGTLSTPLQT